MDKLTIATQVLLKLIETNKTGFDAEGIAGYAWEIADAMQAEADKRENKERPDVLKEEWQPDWSKAPDDAKYWAMDKDHTANFFINKPEITNGNGWDFGGVMQANNTHGFTGNWQGSLRKRPHGK